MLCADTWACAEKSVAVMRWVRCKWYYAWHPPKLSAQSRYYARHILHNVHFFPVWQSITMECFAYICWLMPTWAGAAKQNELIVCKGNKWYLKTTISDSFHDCQRALDSMPLQLVTSFDLTWPLFLPELTRIAMKSAIRSTRLKTYSFFGFPTCKMFWYDPLNKISRFSSIWGQWPDMCSLVMQNLWNQARFAFCPNKQTIIWNFSFLRYFMSYFMKNILRKLFRNLFVRAISQ